MNFSQILLESLESLSSNKLRSGLTILGIIIGVAAVVAMLAVGQGASDSITGSINGIGTNVLFVFSGESAGPRMRNENVSRNITQLSLSDAEALSDEVAAPSIEAVAPVIQGLVDASYQGVVSSTNAYGVTTSYVDVRSITIVEGEFISEEQYLGHASVVVIGPDLAESLFGQREGVVGETIRISNQPFRIIGITESKGGSSFTNEDNQAIIPMTTARDRILQRRDDVVDMIYVQSVDSESANSAADEMTQILQVEHKIPVGEDNDFTVYTQQDMLNTAAQITGILTVFLGGIAAISLLVGGIGIMNIMLVSVAERTREIGLRKALGATKRDILTQFLTESSFLSLLGGIFGIGLGWVISYAVGKIAEATGNPFYPAISISAILLATIFSAVIGIFFGIYPANRAASLQPVEALRND
ncbi:MAG TPA: ABC transporter permease [Anaerolineales bacterium]|nr:ABC transporter permease [Anaerolineales bacterium]